MEHHLGRESAIGIYQHRIIKLPVTIQCSAIFLGRDIWAKMLSHKQGLGIPNMDLEYLSNLLWKPFRQYSQIDFLNSCILENFQRLRRRKGIPVPAAQISISPAPAVQIPKSFGACGANIHISAPAAQIPLFPGACGTEIITKAGSDFLLILHL